MRTVYDTYIATPDFSAACGIHAPPSTQQQATASQPPASHHQSLHPLGHDHQPVEPRSLTQEQVQGSGHHVHHAQPQQGGFIPLVDEVIPLVHEVAPQGGFIPWEEYVWAVATVESRAFGVKLGAQELQLLVPVSDVANHQPGAPVVARPYVPVSHAVVPEGIQSSHAAGMHADGNGPSIWSLSHDVGSEGQADGAALEAGVGGEGTGVVAGTDGKPQSCRGDGWGVLGGDPKAVTVLAETRAIDLWLLQPQHERQGQGTPRQPTGGGSVREPASQRRASQHASQQRASQQAPGQTGQQQQQQVSHAHAVGAHGRLGTPFCTNYGEKNNRCGLLLLEMCTKHGFSSRSYDRHMFV